MQNSFAFYLYTSFVIFDVSLEWLDLELFCSSCWDLYVVVLVEHYWDVVKGLSVHLLPSVLCYDLLLFGVVVQSVADEGLQSRVVSKNQKINAEDSIDLGHEVLEVDLREVSDLKLHASWHIDLTFLALQLHDPETLLYLHQIFHLLRFDLNFHLGWSYSPN